MTFNQNQGDDGRGCTECQRAGAHRFRALYAVINQTNRAIAQIKDRDALLRKVCSSTTDFGLFRLAWIGLIDHQAKEVEVVASSGPAKGYADSLRIPYDPNVREGRGPTGTAIWEDSICVCNDFLSDERASPWRDNAAKYGIHSSAACPLRIGGKVVGVLMLYADQPNFFDEEITDLLADISADLSFALEDFARDEQRRQEEEALLRHQQDVALLGKLVELSSQPVGIGFPDGRLGIFNPAFPRLLGYSSEEFSKIDWATQLTPPEWLESERAKLDELHRTGQPVHYEKEYIRKDGSRVPIELLVHLVSDEHGQPQYYFSFITDISERKQAEQEQRRQKNFLYQVIDTDPSLIYVKDAAGRFLLVNRAQAEMSGMQPGQMIARSAAELGLDELEALNHVEREVIATGQERTSINTLASPTAGERWFLTTKRPLPQPDGSVGVLSVAVDITDRKLAEQLQYLAEYDALTGLPNRRLFYGGLRRAVALARRNGVQLVLLFLDLDRFKEVNDTLGHHIGDQLLQQVAARLRRCVRESDTVARLAGDEFTIIMHDVDSPQDAERVSDKIIASLGQPFSIDGHQVTVGASIGIALLGAGIEHEEELIRLADSAMYAAKRAGRNCYRFHQADRIGAPDYT